MTELPPDLFLKWASTLDLVLDPRYPQSALLHFTAGSDSRFWKIPDEPQRRPGFLATLLDLMGDWSACFVWRHRGRWPAPGRLYARGINDSVELLILKGLGLPRGTDAVVRFGRDERDILAALLFTNTVFGRSVGSDLYVVPDHARQIIRTDHHGVVHVTFAVKEDLPRWVSALARKGFKLPENPPEPTFKRPTWMEQER